MGTGSICSGIMASALACVLLGWAGQAGAVILVHAGSAPLSLQLPPPAQAAASAALLGAHPKPMVSAEELLQAFQPMLEAAFAADVTAPLQPAGDVGPVAAQLRPGWPAVPPAGRRIEAVAGTAVGEPGTYALLAMGLVAVGAALFRQRPWRQAPARTGGRIR